MAQVRVPNSDIVDGNWTDAVGSQVDMYTNIDEDPESSPDDANYLKTGQTAGTTTLGLQTGTDPGVNTNFVLMIRGRNVGGTEEVTYELYCGATLIASSASTLLTTSFANYSFTLTSGQVDSFRTNSGFTGDPRIVLTASGPAISKGDELRVSAAKLQYPDAPASKARVIGGGMGGVIGGILAVVPRMFAIPQLTAYSAIDFKRFANA